MTKDEFWLRTLTASPDADIYILLDNGDWVLVEDLEVATMRAIVLHPQRPLVEATAP